MCTEAASSNTPAWNKSYVYADSRLLSTATKTESGEKLEYHHPDRLGTTLVTDPAAGTSSRQSTLPFGKALGAESTGYTNQVFTSYDRSTATGLDYAINRTYSSGQSRFTQVDPAAEGLNLYAYVGNDPIDLVDPSGLNMCSAENSYGACGGDGGFWGMMGTYQGWGQWGGGGFGNDTAWLNSNFGGMPSSTWESQATYLINLEVQQFLTWLGRGAVYIGNWTWDRPFDDSSATFHPSRGWDRYFDLNSGRFNFPRYSPTLNTGGSGMLPPGIENRMQRELESIPVRTPDYVTVNGSMFTAGGALTLDACGSAYGSFSVLPRTPIDGNASTFRGTMRMGGNVSAGWLNQTSTPRAGTLNNFLTGPAASFSIGSTKVIGGGMVYSPGNGTATEIGVYSPGPGVSISGSDRFSFRLPGWRRCN